MYATWLRPRTAERQGRAGQGREGQGREGQDRTGRGVGCVGNVLLFHKTTCGVVLVRGKTCFSSCGNSN